MSAKTLSWKFRVQYSRALWDCTIKQTFANLETLIKLIHLSGKYVQVHTTNLELKAKNENYFVISCYINIIVQPTSSGIGTQKLGFRDYLPDVYNWGKWNYLYTCIPGLFKNLI